jgi:hypothetical protein
MSGRVTEELGWLIHARRLLAATLDHHRAIVGRVSRQWILSEAERHLPWDLIPPILQRRFQPASGPPPRAIPSNWLPKLEPSLNAHVLAGVILLGPRILGSREIDVELIVATMIHEALGLPDGDSSFLPERHRLVDEQAILVEFGASVLQRLRSLRDHLASFDEAKLPRPEPAYASAIAAVKAARLRLTARAAGDGIFSTLDEPKREELKAKGIDLAEAERPHLERDYLAARAALELPGVHEAIRGPVGDVLLRSVEHVLYHGTPAHELVGKYGSAVHNFHCALPVWEHYSTIVRRTTRTVGGEVEELSGPFALGTVFVTSLEVTRYLHNVRRKTGRTGAAHSFLVSSRIEHLLGPHVSLPVVAGSDCHDVVEDGSYTVSGYDQDLELFAARFGAPLAALVAEVTDSFIREDGPAKASATARHARLVPMEDAYNVGQMAELRARATDPATPFTLEGIILKIADFGVTQQEGLQDPDLMAGSWRHSGARVTWDHWSKGRVIQPLLERLRLEVVAGGSLPPPLVDRLRTVLTWSFDTADLYLAQNLAILAGEHGLDGRQREALLTLFLGEDENAEDPRAFLNQLLDDTRLDPEVKRHGLSASYRLVAEGRPVRDVSRLADYREVARWRRVVRGALDLPPLLRERVDEVLRRWDAR